MDERIKVTSQILRSRFASTGKPLDLAVYIRLVSVLPCHGFPKVSHDASFSPLTTHFQEACSDNSRWYVYDTITQLIYGVPAGMVENGRDVDHLIKEWHHIFTLGGLIATLPWLINPIITSRYLKPFLMPSKRHGTGSGHVMTVSGQTGPF